MSLLQKGVVRPIRVKSGLSSRQKQWRSSRSSPLVRSIRRPSRGLSLVRPTRDQVEACLLFDPPKAKLGLVACENHQEAKSELFLLSEPPEVDTEIDRFYSGRDAGSKVTPYPAPLLISSTFIRTIYPPASTRRCQQYPPSGRRKDALSAGEKDRTLSNQQTVRETVQSPRKPIQNRTVHSSV